MMGDFVRLRFHLLSAALGLASVLAGQSTYRFEEPSGTHTYQRIEPASAGKGGRGSAARSTPAFYDMRELPRAERLAAMPEERRQTLRHVARRTMTHKIHVKLASSRQWSDLLATHPVSRLSSLVEGWTIVRYKDPWAAMDAVDWMTRRGGYTFSPVFARAQAKRQSEPLRRAVNDPLVVNQWHLNPDQGIRMRGSWDFATGAGINIAVIDDGLEVGHEDLLANTFPLAGNFHRNFNDGPDNDPSPLTVDDNHGTSCAGLIAARGFNNLGVIGVAPEARLMGLRLIAGEPDDDDESQAFLWQPPNVVTHVSSNSWGPPDTGDAAGRIGPLAKAALERAATTYRNGLGTVFVFSAGNGRESGDDASYDEYSGGRFAISVGAVNQLGRPSSYSEQGMSVAVSAMGGEQAPPEMIWTTNNMGAESLAKLKEAHATSRSPVNYTDAFNGTSAAAPQVSGAVALMLERNPRLGYRDVKEILMRTARRQGLSGGDPFERNAGNFFFSHSFGAGVIDVAAALETVPSWTNLGPLVSVDATASGAAAIPDGGSGAIASLDFSGARSLRVEHVEFTVDVEHEQRGDVGFALVSPSGMISVAENRPADEGENFENYTFTSVRHWGENSTGVWQVRAIDVNGNGMSGVLRRVTVRIYGTAR